jgi:homoserine kinase type II
LGSFTQLNSTDVRSILAAFGRTDYRSHVPIAAGTINTNLRVECESGPLFLRINEGKVRDEVQREAAIVEYLASRGVSTPMPLLAGDGQRFAAFGASFASVFPWVDGQILLREGVGSTQVASVGRALAELHLKGSQFPDHRSGRYEPEEITRRLEGIVQRNDSRLSAAVDILSPELRALASERYRDVPLGLIHGDLFIDNVLFKPSGEVAALIDFEQASWGRLAYDVAVTLLAFTYGRVDFKADCVRAFLEAYRAVRPPSPEERKAFPAELRFAACRFAVTRITDVFLRQQPGVPGGKDYRRYLDRLAQVKTHLAADDGLLVL